MYSLEKKDKANVKKPFIDILEDKFCFRRKNLNLEIITDILLTELVAE